MRAFFGFFFFFNNTNAGTSDYCNLKFNTPENNVGETQCIICLLDGKAYLLPVSERHETRLNNRPVTDRVALRDLDVISIGARLFWIGIAGGVSVVRNCRFDRPELPEDNAGDEAAAFAHERPTRGMIMTPVKVAEAAAASTQAAANAAACAAMAAGRGSHIGQVSTTVVRDGDTFRATSTVVVHADADEAAVVAPAAAAAAAAAPIAAAPEPFMSPPIERVAPRAVESALPPPKQNKRKAPPSSARHERAHARQLQRSYKKEQDRVEQQQQRELKQKVDDDDDDDAPVEQERARRRTVSSSPVVAAAPADVAENDQNSHSTIKVNFELQKLSTNSSRFAKQWAPVGKRREKKAPHPLQF
jgi:hypothetical protein